MFKSVDTGRNALKHKTKQPFIYSVNVSRFRYNNHRHLTSNDIKIMPQAFIFQKGIGLYKVIVLMTYDKILIQNVPVRHQNTVGLTL